MYFAFVLVLTFNFSIFVLILYLFAHDFSSTHVCTVRTGSYAPDSPDRKMIKLLSNI